MRTLPNFPPKSRSLASALSNKNLLRLFLDWWLLSPNQREEPTLSEITAKSHCPSLLSRHGGRRKVMLLVMGQSWFILILHQGMGG